MSYSLILVLAIVLLAAGVSQLTTQRLQRSIGQSLQDLAFTLSDRLDRDMYYRYRDLAAMVVIARDRETPDGQLIEQAWLEELQQSFPFYKWIGFTDREGNVLVSTGGLLQGLNVSARPWFQGAQDGVFFGDVHDALLLERLLPAQAEPWRFVDVAVPVYNRQDEFVGVLGAHLSWEWVREVQALVLNVATHQGVLEAFVLQPDGTVLFGTSDLEGTVLSLPPATATPTYHLQSMADGRDYLLGQVFSQGYREYPGLGWQIVIRQSADEAFMPVRQLQLNILVWGAVVMLIFFGASLWTSRRITQPLLEITDTARRLRQGDTQARFPHDVGYTEGQSLVNSIRSLTEQLLERERALERAQADLEERIDERTQALNEANRSLHENETRLRLITDNVPAIIAYIDREHRYRFFNRTFLRRYGLTAEQANGMRPQDLLPAQIVNAVVPFMGRALQGEQVSFDREEQVDGENRFLNATYTPDVDDNGVVRGFYVTAMDVTDRKMMELTLQHQSDHDTLTGLPNRSGLKARLARAVARAMRHGHPLALCFVDLDHFKTVNDTLGHAAGDELLQQAAQRLSATVRTNDTVARLGGDEFLVVLEDLQHPEKDAEAIAEKLIERLAQPFDLNHGTAQISASVGIAIDRQIDGNTEALLSRADKAMYAAKEQGKNRFIVVAD